MGQVMFVHTEADLIQAARAGDGSAFAELVRPHYQAAFRVAFARGRPCREQAACSDQLPPTLITRRAVIWAMLADVENEAGAPTQG
jgi:hypothetical protein